MSTDLPALITAIGGAVAAILGGVSAVILALRKVSPTERTRAVAEAAETPDQAQDRRLAELERRLRPPSSEPPASDPTT